MKTKIARSLATILLAGAILTLSSCVYPYSTGSYSRLGAYRSSPPLLSTALALATSNARTSYWSSSRSYYPGGTAYGTSCSPRYTPVYGNTYSTRIARPYYSNYGWGAPYYGSSWYSYPYTSQWRSPGYSRYQSYGSPLASFGWPMSHYGGWSYVNRPSYGYGGYCR